MKMPIRWIQKTPLAQYEEGESTTALKVVKSAGIDPATGQEVFIKLNGERTFEYSADDKFVIGDTEPRFRGTVSTNLFYKVSVSICWVVTNVVLTCTTRLVPRKWKVQTRKRMRINGCLIVVGRIRGDIAFYKDIADSDGMGENPKHSDRSRGKRKCIHVGNGEFRL